MMTIVCLCLLAFVCFAGWMLTEDELLNERALREAAEADLDVALGWVEERTVESGVVHPTLSLVEGGDA